MRHFAWICPKQCVLSWPNPSVIRQTYSPLGARPDRARLEARHVSEFVRKLRASGRPDALPSAIIVDHASAEQIDKLVLAAGSIPLIIALPSVFFEADLTSIRQLISFSAAAGLSIEANSWGGWKLAREGNALVEAGPALGILNTLAASMLQERGCRAVTLAVEADPQTARRDHRHLPGPPAASSSSAARHSCSPG